MDKHSPHNVRGFSLIEVLVTLLLTSVGILGMAAMQAKAIAYTQDSIQRNTAAMLADELMEILRADQGKIIAVDGTPRATSDYYKLSNADFPAVTAEEDCRSLPDAPAERLGCWAKRASQVLPGVTPALLKSDFRIQPKDATIEIQLAWSVAKGACMAADVVAEDSEEGDDESGEEGDDENNTADICHYRLRAEL